MEDFPHIDVKGENETFTLLLNKRTSWLTLYDEDASVTFTQKDAKSLLPYLQSFADHGTIEPAPPPPLQGEEQLADFQERIQHAFHQETKDCVLCQTVILLSRFAPNEVRKKALDLLRTYNSEERIAQPPLQIMATQKEQEERIDMLEKEKQACFSQIDNLIDESADLQEQLETMQEAGVAMAANITDQGKRIEALTQAANDACENIDDLEKLAKLQHQKLAEWYPAIEGEYGLECEYLRGFDEIEEQFTNLLGEGHE